VVLAESIAQAMARDELEHEDQRYASCCCCDGTRDPHEVLRAAIVGAVKSAGAELTDEALTELQAFAVGAFDEAVEVIRAAARKKAAQEYAERQKIRAALRGARDHGAARSYGPAQRKKDHAAKVRAARGIVPKDA